MHPTDAMHSLLYPCFTLAAGRQESLEQGCHQLWEREAWFCTLGWTSCHGLSTSAGQDVCTAPTKLKKSSESDEKEWGGSQSTYWPSNHGFLWPAQAICRITCLCEYIYIYERTYIYTHIYKYKHTYTI